MRDAAFQAMTGAKGVFGFGNKKAKLEKQYKRLLEESYKLSHVDRKKSDLKAEEAEVVRRELEQLEAE